MNCHIYSNITEPSSATAVYIHGGGDVREKIPDLINENNFALVFIEGINWNDDTTPWPAEGVLKGGSFGGRADEYIKTLTGEIIPQVEAELGFVPKHRAIAGYSLGGLLAIYSLYKTDIFDLAASMSGSLWYDGFVDFVRTHEPLKSPKRIYLSLGDREKKTKNPRMAQVEAAAGEIKNILLTKCESTVFELKSGNHFVDAERRIADGINYILKES